MSKKSEHEISEEKRQKACYIIFGHFVVGGICTNCGWGKKRDEPS